MRMDPQRDESKLHSRRRFLRLSAGSCLISGLSGALLRSVQADTRLAARIAEAPATHVIQPALRKASQGLEKLSSVKDYEATLVRQELVGTSLINSRMELKLRHEPFSVYLKYLEPSAGREVIYVDGKNDGNLQVHETGFKAIVGTLSLDPKGSLAMDGNRHPVTMAGLRKMVELTIEEWLLLARRDDVKVNFYASSKIGDLPCQTYETVVEKPSGDVRYSTIRLYFEAATGLPVRVQSFGLPAKPGEKPPLVEDYCYTNLKTNVGLTDVDFDVKNPKYGF